MKYVALALLLFTLGAGLLLVNGEQETYVPIVRVRTPDGLFVTAVQSTKNSKAECKQSIGRFLTPLGTKCENCAIDTECVAEPSGMEGALAKGEDVPVHTVLSKGIRFALVGPPQAMQQACEYLASQIASMGVSDVSCVAPGQAAYEDEGTYHPVVQISLPDGLNALAVLPGAKEAPACSATNDRFIEPFKTQCKECKLIMARCERKLDGLALAMEQGAPVPHPLVVARDIRIALTGPLNAARMGCEKVAADMVAKGVRSAACIQPQVPSAKS